MSWLKITELNSIQPLGSRVLQVDEIGAIALFRTSDNQVFAIQDRCPHKGGPLSQGIVHGCKVTCPLHSWVIELETGLAVAPDQGSTPTFKTKIEKGWVYLWLT